MRRFLCVWLILLLVPSAYAEVVITRHNISWTIDGTPTCGSFVNGDPWCVGPITITAISPASVVSEGRIRHGSTLNPTTQQGYDSQFGITYEPDKNVARPGGSDLSSSNPLVIPAGNSLVSTSTKDIAYSRPMLVDASVLTVVGTQPSTGSFRPPFAPHTKISRWNIADVQWDLLPKLTLPASAPALNDVATYFERFWFDGYGGTAGGREFHPSANMPDYGGSMARKAGQAYLTVLGNYTQAQIKPIMIGILQYGIDIYGTIEATADIYDTVTSQGGLWMGGGGHGLGRKWPLIFTGLMLNDQDILEYGDGQVYPIFQEEQQHFFVSQRDVDEPRYTGDGKTREPYLTTDIGLPEWGEQHWKSWDRDNKLMTAEYRNIVSMSLSGHVLAAIIMGQTSRWNWPSLFQHQDRWHEYRIANNLAMSAYDSPFYRDMWDTYRKDYPPAIFNFNPRRLFRNVRLHAEE